MSIIVRNNKIKVAKGNIPLRSIMLGETCIYGENLTTYKLSYPAIPKGAGLKISVNGKTSTINTEGGYVGVAENDKVSIRVYGLENYKNPISSLTTSTEEINGEVYSIKLNDKIIIDRATKYEFIVKTNSTLNIESPEIAPKLVIPIIKDEGVESIDLTYLSSPYNVAFATDKSFSSSTLNINETSDSIELFYGSKVISTSFKANYNEGYKSNEYNLNYTGFITDDNQCVITASSIKGKIVSVTCPALTLGVNSYYINIVHSYYSRNFKQNTKIYTGSSNQITINQRSHEDNTYYLYEDDTIEIYATRKNGYKFPTLGVEGDLSKSATHKSIKLSGDTTLIVRPGEAGQVISLINNPLSTGEYVLMNVVSEYTDSQNQVQNPTIYRGDRITIPLNPQYRIGTYTNRKPGVGLTDGRNTLHDVM